MQVFVKHPVFYSVFAIVLFACTPNQIIADGEGDSSLSYMPTITAAISSAKTPRMELCPEPNPKLVPDFTSLLADEEFPDLELPVLDFLNAGGTSKAVVEFFSHGNLEYDEKHFFERDLTGDGIPELAISYLHLYIFGCYQGDYRMVLKADNYDLINSVPAPWIVSSADMNLNGVPDIVVESYFKPSTLVRIYEWDGEHFQSLIKGADRLFDVHEDVAYLGDAETSLADVDNNGTVELLLTGGIPTHPSIFMDGYPWRQVTITYMWNGENFTLQREELAPPQYKFQAIQDGDRASIASDYAPALELYALILNGGLESWSEADRENFLTQYQAGVSGRPTPTSLPIDLVEKESLSAYARYRIMLLYLLQQDESQAQVVYNTLQRQYSYQQPGYSYAELATAFWTEYQLSRDMGQACAKAMDYAVVHPEILKPLGSDYHGWQSDIYEPEDICPFK